MSVLQRISPNVRGMGAQRHTPLANRAAQIREELQQGTTKPFRELIDMMRGDSQSAGIKPLTFTRQVLAACLFPPLLDTNQIPADARQRAVGLLRECHGGSLGSYTDLHGIPLVALQISEFIARRDGGDPPKIENILVSSGSQWALQRILSLLVHDRSKVKTGVLTPAPGHVTTLSSLAVLGAVSVPYHLREEQGWELQMEELNRALDSAKRVCKPVALYIINPGSPSGHVQRKSSIKDVIQFAFEKRLFLLADEVHQDCVHSDDVEFVSYKKVLAEMGPPFSESVELASFNSASQGVMGECDFRGGYVELVNMDPEVKKHALELLSQDSAPTAGQIALSVLAKPPQPGDPSFPLYETETRQIRSMITANASRVHQVMNGLSGVSCQPVEGGAFAFPRVTLPPRAIQKATALGLEPDSFYCLRLLEESGVLTSPGCEYGQKEGTHHIRYSRLKSEYTRHVYSFSIWAPADVMEDFLSRFITFHTGFMEEFS